MNTDTDSVVKLRIEDGPTIVGPTIAQLFKAIDQMRPTGPAFVIVERGIDYAQAGGGNGEYAVEWREYGEPFMHLLVGKGIASEIDHTVRMHYGSTTVHRHEVLSKDDVKKLLGAMLVSGFRPDGYLWRDVSYAFKKSNGKFVEHW